MFAVIQKNKVKALAGVTWIEVACIVAILVFLVSLAIPTFATYVRQSRAAEVQMNLRTIYDAEVSHFQKIASDQMLLTTGKGVFSWDRCTDDYNNGPLCYAFTYSHLGDTGIGIPPKGIKKTLSYHFPPPQSPQDASPFDWWKSFPTLGINLDAPTAFAFSVYPGVPELQDRCYRASDYWHWTFSVNAYGDLDGDNNYSTFTRVGYVGKNGEAQSGVGLYSNEPLE